MTTSNLLNVIGLSANILGTIFLTYSLSKYLLALHGAIAIHDMGLTVLINGKREAWVAQDMGNLLKKGAKNGRARTMSGLFFVIAGFILQLVSCFL